MPTYEYKCRACSHAFEQFQKISDEPTRTCPSCGEDAVQRLISSGGGLVFKGSGFYATDYRNDSGGSKSSGESDGSGSGGSADSGSGGSTGSGSSGSGDGKSGADGD